MTLRHLSSGEAQYPEDLDSAGVTPAV